MEPRFLGSLFTGKTWEEFLAAGGTVAGFRESRWSTVQRMQRADVLLCYITGVSRWIGALEVTGNPYLDSTSMWKDEVFPARVPVKVLIELQPESSIPIRSLAGSLSYFQRGTPHAWTGHFLRSPTMEREEDAVAVMKALQEAQASPVSTPLSQALWSRRPSA